MNSIRLVQFTDTHVNSDPAGELRGVTPLQTLQATIAHASHRFAAADAVLLTGDLVHDDVGGYALVKQLFGSSPVPVYCVPGNHDVPSAMRTALNDAPFKVGGFAILEPWLIYMLDTWVENSASGRIGPQQLSELDAVLAAHSDLHVLICLHHHPVAMGSRWLDEVSLEDAEEFLDTINKHRNVRGVLWGHVHQAFDCFMKGVRYMATPATCMQFLPHSEEFAIDQKPPGYRVLELQPDGSIATEVLWLHPAYDQTSDWPDRSLKTA